MGSPNLGGQGLLSPRCWACLKGCACPQVGILDVDLCGPSIPRMLRVQDSAVHQCDSGWVPVFVGQDKAIALMSIGFLLERPDDAVVWRGPKKNGKNWGLLLVKPPGEVIPWGNEAAVPQGWVGITQMRRVLCCAGRQPCPLSLGPVPQLQATC